jgi:hypothetical protein
MKKERPLVTVKYIGENTFVQASEGFKTFTFPRNKDVKITHELLETMLEAYTGEMEVVSVDSDEIEIVETNLNELIPEVKTVSRRGRRS